MSKKIFRSICLAAVAVLLVSLTLVMAVMYQHFEDQVVRELQTEADYLAADIRRDGADILEEMSLAGRRITLVSPDGQVIYDSDAEAAAMENHLEREEIQEALAYGSGVSQRTSDTLTEQTIYYAQRLEDGTVLRLSTGQTTIWNLLLSSLPPVMVILLIAVILSALLSSVLSRAIIRPLNELDLDHLEDAQVYDELAPLVSRLNRQRRTIQRQLEASRQKQEEFRLITENMQEGLLVIDSETNLLSCNKASLHMLGLSEKPEGSVLRLDRSQVFREAVEQGLAGEHVVEVMPYEERSYQLMVNPARENGKVIGAVLVILDVTEQTEREQLRQEFTANVSHELKTPLTSISGFAELMKTGTVDAEDVVDFSTTIYDEAQRLITLVNDIIKLSELDEKQRMQEEEIVDLHDLAGETLRRLQPEADRRKISLSLQGSAASIMGVRKILGEMVYNLCDNAIKYNREGGSVLVTVEDLGHQVRLAVRDTGIGISPAHQQRVFERFYRVDKSHSREIGGTGLGLSIVKRGAMFHHADLSLESALGKGTTVTLVFHRAAAGAEK